MDALSLKKVAVVLAVGVLALSLSACGQSRTKSYTIGIVNVSPQAQRLVDGFKSGMAERGFVEGDNLTYIHEDGGGNLEGLEQAVHDLVASDIDLILALATPIVLKVKRATEGSDIPVVFAPVYDPVKSGIVNSLVHPGGNLTGIRGGGLIPKQLELLLAIVPRIERTFLLHNPDDNSSVRSLRDLTEVADKLGIELVVSEVRTSDQVLAALDAVPENVDAYFHLPVTLMYAHISKIVETAIKHKLPITSLGVSIDDGVLMSLGPDQFRMGEQASRLAANILRGTAPGDLPVETPEFSLGINLQTANAIGLDVPDDVLRLADNIIR